MKRCFYLFIYIWQTKTRTMMMTFQTCPDTLVDIIVMATLSRLFTDYRQTLAKHKTGSFPFCSVA